MEECKKISAGSSLFVLKSLPPGLFLLFIKKWKTEDSSVNHAKLDAGLIDAGLIDAGEHPPYRIRSRFIHAKLQAWLMQGL